MKTKKRMKKIGAIALAAVLSLTAAGCSTAQVENADSGNAATSPTTGATTASTGTTAAQTAVQDSSGLFSDRDLKQSADLADATQIQLASGQDVTLTEEGVYVLSGEAENVTVVVEAADDAKIQIVLDGVGIANEDAPAIYVKAADKVFVTTAGAGNRLEVSEAYAADGDTNLDAVIFSRADLTLNGTGSLAIVSAQGNGISSKDDLKITGGTYDIQAAADGLEANDAILINGGMLTIASGKDALHSENDEDATLGYIRMLGGSLQITAADDALQGNSYVQIDGGSINVASSEEGIEGTSVIINGGEITINANDDGINAAQKVDGDVRIEVNGGMIRISMASGDTDAFDSNGDLYINGGTLILEGGSIFDADGTAELNGGDVTANGEKITEITVTRGGGGPMGAGGRGMR